jgi:class 3 adenylate cyclase/tetratricopeptide (TPR) repeat protein
VATCTICGETNLDSARYCSSCGAEIRPDEERREDREEREERRVVTVLFCDLVDSTARFHLADPEDVRATLAAYLPRVQREIERFGGTVEKFVGDAVLAVYGVPSVHEDDAQRALYSALRILPVIEEMNEEAQIPMAVRLGVETGEAVVDLGGVATRQGMVFGDVVNTASRLQSAAPTGGILVGERTYRLTSSVFDFEPMEPVRVKGKADPLPVWIAKGARSRFGTDLQRPVSTPWVDRDDELELLKRTFARAVREPSVQLVTLMGEPGVGKSRLVTEFFVYADDLPETTSWRQGRCLPYGEGVTFWGLGEIVKAQAGILGSDGAREADEKLAAAVSAVVPDPAEQGWVHARLAPLIGLADANPEGIERGEAFSAWRRFIEAIASMRPLVLVLEDVHWADAALLAFIEHVVEWSSGAPILVICTARPELFDREPGWGGGKRNWSTISLAPLDDGDTQQLISGLLPAEASPDLVEMVIERAGGNPLFAEELSRMLGEQPSLGPEIARGTEPPRTPEGLYAIIAARLDTLPVPERSLIQDASVVGKVFWAGVLSSMGGVDRASVDSALHQLARKEIVRPSKVSSIEAEVEFSFWHGLIRDVAYGQIPRRRRAAKHVAAAAWIEEIAGERVSDQAELLAYHYGEALELSRSAGVTDEAASLQDKTRRYWVLAGERAMKLDVARAAECFGRALSLVPATHPDRASILARMAAASFDAGKYREAERTYEQALELFREAGDQLSVGTCLDRLATVLWDEGDPAGCRARLDEALEILEELPHGTELADCYATLASERTVSGHLEEAIAWAERSLDLSSRLGAEHLRPRALSYRGVARCFRGDLDGVEDLEDALRIAGSLGLARESVMPLLILAEIAWATRGPSSAIETAGRAEHLANQRGLGEIEIASRTTRLGPLFDLGRWDELLDLAGDVIEWSAGTGARYEVVSAQPWAAQVLQLRGRLEEASVAAAHFIKPAREVGDPQVLFPAAVAAGWIALAEGRTDEAAHLIEEVDRAADVSAWYREHFLADLVRLCSGIGNLAAAERLVGLANAFTERHRLSLATARAVLHEAKGELGPATETYLESAQGWASYGHVVEAARAWLGAGRCLAMTHTAEAAPHLERAREAFSHLGAVGLLADAEHELRAIGKLD